MFYNEIQNNSIANGVGIRVVLWTQGCPHMCRGCHNPHTWNEKQGKPFTDKERDFILEKLDEHIPKNFSVLGGEPLAPYNIVGVTELVKYIKKVRPHTNIWIWTGYLFEEFYDHEILNYIDVLVDGKFELDKKDLSLQYCGSSNQRVIDVQKTLQENKVVLYTDKQYE